jgi:hypothetical protein
LINRFSNLKDRPHKTNIYLKKLRNYSRLPSKLRKKNTLSLNEKATKEHARSATLNSPKKELSSQPVLTLAASGIRFQLIFAGQGPMDQRKPSIIMCSGISFSSMKIIFRNYPPMAHAMQINHHFISPVDLGVPYGQTNPILGSNHTIPHPSYMRSKGACHTHL